MSIGGPQECLGAKELTGRHQGSTSRNHEALGDLFSEVVRDVEGRFQRRGVPTRKSSGAGFRYFDATEVPRRVIVGGVRARGGVSWSPLGRFFEL